MLEPDERGFIRPTGDNKGGHAIMANRLALKEDCIELPNTWSLTWGIRGKCKLKLDALEYLLQQNGECCLPIGRKIITSW